MNAKLDRAVKAAEAPEQRVSVQVSVGPERFVVVNVPVDMTAMEMLALLAYLPNGLPKLLAGQRAPGPRLLVPASARVT